MNQLRRVVFGLLLAAVNQLSAAQAVSVAVPAPASTPAPDKAVAPPLTPGENQLARYSVALPVPAPDASNPLAVIAVVSFPRAQVQTVGDAVRHLLLRTGYRLSAPEHLGEGARELLELPLPESHRRLGPYRVDAMLKVLLGDPWALSIDAKVRAVAFHAQPEAAAGSLAAVQR